jgi:hypothetical protein
MEPWIAIAAVGIYFVPSLVATQRRKRNLAAIVALNVLLGWTLLGWCGALIWALLRDREAPQPVALSSRSGLGPLNRENRPPSATSTALRFLRLRH